MNSVYFFGNWRCASIVYGFREIITLVDSVYFLGNLGTLEELSVLLGTQVLRGTLGLRSDAVRWVELSALLMNSDQCGQILMGQIPIDSEVGRIILNLDLAIRMGESGIFFGYSQNERTTWPRFASTGERKSRPIFYFILRTIHAWHLFVLRTRFILIVFAFCDVFAILAETISIPR